MPIRIVRRSVGLAAGLSLLASSLVFADTVGADADTVTPVNDTSKDLGQVAPGAEVSFDLDFRLTCKNGSHPDRGTSFDVTLDSSTLPDGGAAVADGGTVGPIPDDWPLDGEFCFGSPTLLSSTPAHVTLTAPTAIGDDYQYVLLFAKSSGDGLTGLTSLTATLDVVADSPPVDTTDPVLSGVPGDRTVTTAGTSAVVTWTLPTATDDVDPAPSVTCNPASGTAFALGTTTVTCTATDASGNDASASFQVTVVRASATFEQPVGNSGTVSVSSSRTLPIKAQLLRAGTEVVSGEAWVWLGRCGGEAARVDQMQRNGGRWMGHLDTSSLAPGCYEVTVRAGGATYGGFELRVAGSASTASKPKTKG